MFSKQLLAFWISLIESFLPFSKGFIDEYLEKERAKLHRTTAHIEDEGQVRLSFYLLLLLLFYPASKSFRLSTDLSLTHSLLFLTLNPIEEFTRTVVGFALDCNVGLLYHLDHQLLRPRLSAKEG